MYTEKTYPSCTESFGSLVLGEHAALWDPSIAVPKADWAGGNRPEAKLLTKGDNNAADDTELYARDQDYLARKDIIGSVVAYIPFVGYVTILLSENPWLKTAMLGLMGLVVILQRE